jgi:cytochrome c1
MNNACIQCHAIAGVSGGVVGPNLTHFASRTTYGSATFDTEPEGLFEWIKHARLEKPGVLMPDFDRPLPKTDPAASFVGNSFRTLTADEIRQLVAYLLTLK